MASLLPDGDPVPDDGALPDHALDEAASRRLGIYVHVPFCAVRCGYCDFNTYTATELAGGADQARYADSAIREIDLAAQVLGRAPREVETVFFGGGTPTLLPVDDLGRVLAALRDRFGLAADAEVTTEANPESVTAQSLRQLRDTGFTRVSFGMQSAVPHVLTTLDRRHTPGRASDVVVWARDAGFEQVSIDLIYGTPGESRDDWRRSLDAVVALEVDHVSAYSLIVEDGTAMARDVARGLLAAPDEDDLADKYVMADEVLGSTGLSWYEVSNWARDPSSRCRHNLGYWRGDDWWGIGPGAHSHVGGVRWWNVKHPRAYAQRLEAGVSPGAGRELLDQATRRLEQVLLEVRLSEGIAVDGLDSHTVDRLVAEGLVDPGRRGGGRVVLTRSGRLLADAVVRSLVDPD
ncbi:MAG: radical SAM family heme chaperone HemW [Actinomycetes bacterium]